jgi:hypothetical protein
MKESNLIASVALFGELYNNDKYNNITDIIAEFIKGAVCSEHLYSSNSTELTLALQRIFEFSIPEAVVKTTLKNRLKKFYTYENGRYYFDSKELEKGYATFNQEYDEINTIQTHILKGLFEYIETNASIVLEDKSKKEVTDNFVKWLLDNGYSEKYTNVISAYIVTNKNNFEFIKNLNQVREGLILYQGIKYTSDVNDLGNWNSELKIFLNTEHLFNAVGYNGEVYKQIFYDFLELVNKINQKSRNRKGDKLIELRYFHETELEIDSFFQTAELIKRGNRALDPSKAAMRSILQGCQSPADIKIKRTNFIKEINQLGISLQETNTSAYAYHDYIVEDESIVGMLEKESKEKGKLFNKDEYDHFCRMFTKINYYRGGVNDNKFEKIGHIFLTANRFALWLAHNPKVKFKENDIPFAADIEYITSRFWFKLCKGFGESASLPKSLEVVTKAQVILSSQVNSSVAKKYDDLQQAYKERNFDKEQFLALSYSLREKTMMPEDIDDLTVENSLDFILEEDYIETFYRDKELREQHVNELEQQKNVLQREVEVLKDNERKRIAEEKEKQRLEDLDTFLDARAKEHTRSVKNDIFYFFKAGLFLYLALLLIFLIKVPVISTEIDKIGIWGYAIIITLAFFGASELFVRTFIWDKERVKRGRNLFWLSFNKKAKEEKMAEIQQEWIFEFDSTNSIVDKV